MLDAVIIGGGPAALSASINLKVRNKEFVLLGGTEKTTGLMKAPQIDNYLGFMKTSGSELLDTFKKHVVSMGIEIKKEKVYSVLSMGDYFAVNAGNQFYEAKTLIIATGHAKANYYEGEKEYLGRGIGYCATCDGPLYKNKPIAIISENEEGEEEANYLSEICSKVHYVPLYDKVINLKSNIQTVKGKVLGISGDGSKANLLRMDSGELPVDAVFIIRNVIPVDQLIEGLEPEDGSIKVDKNMATSIPGVFACGDCAGKPYQISKAVGEGSIAALSAVRYMDSKKLKAEAVQY